MSRYSKSDYINREMASDCIVIECDGVTLEQARQALKDCPSADVVEVVRCKDCTRRNIKCGMGEHRWCDFLNMSTKPNDYCSYGERKDDECE